MHGLTSPNRSERLHTYVPGSGATSGTPRAIEHLAPVLRRSRPVQSQQIERFEHVRRVRRNRAHVHHSQRLRVARRHLEHRPVHN